MKSAWRTDSGKRCTKRFLRTSDFAMDYIECFAQLPNTLRDLPLIMTFTTAQISKYWPWRGHFKSYVLACSHWLHQLEYRSPWNCGYQMKTVKHIPMSEVLVGVVKVEASYALTFNAVTIFCAYSTSTTLSGGIVLQCLPIRWRLCQRHMNNS